jgi:voltage-gated potassium channel
LGVLGTAIAVGTLGYIVIEGVEPFDALYMTIITVSTVGFAETFPLSTAGRILTMVVIFTGVGTALYTASVALEMGVVNFEQRREIRLQKTIDALRDHHIICGFGRVGESVWGQLSQSQAVSVVVEMDLDRVDSAREAGALVVEGDATHNQVLEAAGIQRAQSVIACVRDDSENIVIVMSARSMKQDLFIASRAADPEFERKLITVGADRVVAPQSAGGHRLAAMALHHDIVVVFDLFSAGGEEFKVQEVTVTEGCRIAGRTLREAQIRQRSGALILMMRLPNGRAALNPDPDQSIDVGATLIAVGTDDQIADFVELL